MDEAATVALELLSANGRHGMSEQALRRRHTSAAVTEPAMQSSLDQLAAEGLIERTIRTRSAGWVYVLTPAGAEHLRP